MPKPIYILNGPNLNLLGEREPHIYGAETLQDLEKRVAARAKAAGYATAFRQSNREGELVDWIQEAREKGAAVIINAAAYSHTSIAILDALKAVDVPVIEVHLSNIHRREAFRHHSYVSAAADGVIVGLGPLGYDLAVDAAISLAKSRE
ncbi:MAG: type II 3-dehydroquinate dehydratase [Alphaproteobacteria bacterium]|nr:type II 3-dehydroquinate dehydratase [Alphaproteobacteria bacterium]